MEPLTSPLLGPTAMQTRNHGSGGRGGSRACIKRGSRVRGPNELTNQSPQSNSGIFHEATRPRRLTQAQLQRLDTHIVHFGGAGTHPNRRNGVRPKVAFPKASLWERGEIGRCLAGRRSANHPAQGYSKRYPGYRNRKRSNPVGVQAARGNHDATPSGLI